MPWYPLEGLTQADAAFLVEGADLEEVFRSAWEAALQVMLPDPLSLRPQERRLIALSNPATDMLLFDFLQELIYYKDADGLLLRLEKLRIEDTGQGWRLEAEAAGETPEPSRHALGIDVKAVTLHRFALERTDGGWRATMILDV